MKQHIVVLYIILSLFLLTSCRQLPSKQVGSDYQVEDMSIEKELSVDDFLEDYDILWEELEANYIFFPVLEEKGMDLASIKENMRENVSREAKDSVTYYQLLEQLFQELENFAHLSVVDPYLYRVYTERVDQGFLVKNLENVLKDSQTQKFYHNLEHDTAIFHDVTHPDVEMSYDQDQKVIYFKIPSFDTILVDRDQTLVKDYLESLGDVSVEHIVFDITGNVGGDDTYWVNNIVRPFGGEYTWSSWIYLKDTPITREYCFDIEELYPINELPDEHVIPEFVEQLGLTHYMMSEWKLSGESALPEDTLNAKRWLLIDERVYSSADSFADFCKSTGWATLVGKSTGGDGPGIVPLPICLPNTGILVRFSVACGETSDGELNTVTGTCPDYYPARRETIRQAFNRLIKE